MNTPSGQALRDQGVENVMAAATAAHRPWREQAEAALNELIQSGYLFTSEDIQAMCTDKPHHPNAWGALIIGAKKAGRIEYLRHVKPTKRSSHARLIGQWRGVQSREAA